MHITINITIALILTLVVAGCDDVRTQEVIFADSTVSSITDNGREQVRTLTRTDGTIHTTSTFDFGSQPIDCEYDRWLLIFTVKKCSAVTKPRYATLTRVEKGGEIIEESFTYEYEPGEIAQMLGSFTCKVCAAAAMQ